MDTKTVKEKVEKIMVDYMRNPNSNSLYVPVKVLDKIDKLYRKEMKNKFQDLFDKVQYILIGEGVNTRIFNRILKVFVSHNKTI